MVKKSFFFTFFMALSFIAQSQIKIHSHNDYSHHKPFFDAVNYKVFSIEADIFLLGDSLVVAHSKKEIKTGNTLYKMYLQSIKALSKTKRFYSFQLMIDIKTDWTLTYPVLLKMLSQFKESFKNGRNKVSIVISGSRPADSTFHTFPDVINFDGLPAHSYHLNDLKKVAMISDNFAIYSQWKGNGEITQEDKGKLLKVINEAHSIGKPIRFWNAPDNNACWVLLQKLGVDIINTDKIQECTTHFKTK